MASLLFPHVTLACRQDEAGGQFDGAYTLSEAAVLARSSVAGQRAAALRLVAGALEQARQLHRVNSVGLGFDWRVWVDLWLLN